MNGMVDAIKIVHDEESKLDFVFLAEFLRFIGVQIGEDQTWEFMERSEESIIKEKDIYVCCVYMGDPSEARLQEKLPANTFFLNDIKRNELEVGETVPVTRYKPTQRNSMLLSCLEKMYSWLAEKVGDGNAALPPQRMIDLQQLIQIYEDNNIMLHSANMQYYPRKASFAIDEARKAFLNAYDALKNMKPLKDQYALCHSMYAKLWCAMKVNSACEYSEKLLYFNTDKLAGECMDMIKRYQEFYNFKVLLGLCYESSPLHVGDAILAFQEAVKSVKVEDCVSTIYYWIARRFEVYKKEQARIYYTKAYRIKNKFRNIYKMAILELFRGNDCADDYYNEILKKLKRRIEINYLDPLELEYAFKSYANVCVLTNKYDGNNFKKIVEYGEKAENIVVKLLFDNKYYDDLYGKNKANQYRELSKTRMGMVNVYRVLAIAYSNMLNKDKSDEYLNKALMLKG